MSDKKDCPVNDNFFDTMWQSECNTLLPWFYGRGADIGCGARSLLKDIVRVDIDENVKPDVLASGDNLPFKDGEFDFICSIHSFEHFEDQVKTLKEWLRVLKPGGIIGIVHPDLDFTKKQKPASDNPGLSGNKYNRHYHEHNHASFLKQLAAWSDLPFELVDTGVACGSWSFFVILKKKR